MQVNISIFREVLSRLNKVESEWGAADAELGRCERNCERARTELRKVSLDIGLSPTIEYGTGQEYEALEKVYTSVASPAIGKAWIAVKKADAEFNKALTKLDSTMTKCEDVELKAWYDIIDAMGLSHELFPPPDDLGTVLVSIASKAICSLGRR